MPITREFLADGEEVLLDLRPHWVFLFGPLLLTLVASAIAIAVAVEFSSAPVAVAWLLTAVVAIPGIWLAGRLVRWAGTSLIVTTQRLVLRRGVFGRDLTQLRLQRITEIHSSQTPLERLIGAGRLVVEVEGDNQAIAVGDVRRPKSLQRVLNNRLDELDGLGSYGTGASRGRADAPSPATSPAASADPFAGAEAPTPPHGVGLPGSSRVPVPPARPSAGSASSVPEQLIQLDDLRRRGIVTAAEFEAKKIELLGRL